jgi:outer membrane protein
MKIKFSILLIISLITTFSYAQQSWSLQQCIDYALKNNANIQQYKLQVEQAESGLEFSKVSLLPTLNASASNYYNIGRRIDLYTNKFADKRVRSDNFSVSTGVTLFNGLQQYNTIKQNQENVNALKLDQESNTQTIILNIVSAYMNVLYAMDQLQAAQNQIALTKLQEARNKKLFEAGSVAKTVLLDIQAQVASEDVAVVNAQNAVDIAYLNLTLLMDLPSQDGFSIVKPSLDENTINENLSNPETALNYAYANQPSIKAADARIKAAYASYLVAKGSLLPSLSFGASIGTGFSGLATTVTGYAPQVYVSGISASGDSVYSMQMVPTGTKLTPYHTQLKNNINKSFGFQLNIPIFNGFQVKNQMTRTKISYKNAQLNVAIAKREVNRNVKQAYADAIAAVKKFKATQKAVDANQASFENYETRFNLGVINAFEYNDAKTRLAKAKIDLLQAKYDYFFRIKILEYYQGKPIAF